jgi:Tfp pilus assembly protein PilX
MKTSRIRKTKNKASSLVVSLLVIVLLSIILVAFVQTMSLARANSKGYAEFRKATLAAEAGLDMALTQLLIATGTNAAFVTGMMNYPDTNYPVTVIGARDLTDATQIMPLVSGPTNQLVGFGQSGWEVNFASYASARTNRDATVGLDVNTARHFIQKTNNENLYRASWVVMTNTTGATPSYTRFAYVVLDDTARVNPTLHTGAGDGLTNAVDWYSGPQDIALTNAAARLLSDEQVVEVLANPQVFQMTDATLGQSGFATRGDYEAVKHLFTSQTNASFDVIPGRMIDGGKPKYDINDLATNTIHGASAAQRAGNIANIIGRNLTNFEKRDPALRDTDPTKYLNRLAANIVDYIDSDDEFTAVGGELAGMEVTAFPYRLAERLRCIEGGYSETPHKRATVETQFFVGVWNPSSRPVTIVTAHLRVWNRPGYTFSNGIGKTTPEYKFASLTENLTLRPNEFGVLAFPTQILPTITASLETKEPPTFDEVRNGKYVQYEFSINGQIVARSQGVDAGGVAIGGGLDQDDTRTRGENDADPAVPDNEKTMHVLMGTDNRWMVRQLDTVAMLGDPRFARFSHTVWGSGLSAGSWGRTPWKGPALPGANAPGANTLQDFSTTWAPRDYLPRNATKGVGAGLEVVTPDTLPSQYDMGDGSAAPQFIRNGAMRSIGELGFIYDPAHASSDLNTNNPVGSGKFAYQSPYQNGGARTLRIGQPESAGTGSNNWNTNGYRAMELLDLFTVLSTNSVSGGTPGRINPNTAPPEVLAAVLSGIKVASDTGDSIRSLTNSASIASQIVANRPYSSISDLYKIAPQFLSTANYTPAPSYYLGSGMARLPRMMDKAREEAFGKLVPHLTVQSRSYRVYAVGQVLDASQKPRGSVAIEAGVNIQWNEAEQRFQPVTQYVRTLK